MEENTIINEEITTTESADTAKNKGCEIGEEIHDSATDKSEAAPDATPSEENDNESTVKSIDYSEVARRDIEALRSDFPELRELNSITELENPMRYAALRDMGLEPREAYLATSKRVRKTDTRSHLVSAAPKGAHSPANSMYGNELDDARALFSDMTDSEIQNLYRKVTK